jgi:hypothetical protein
MWPSDWTKNETELAALLARWRGARGQVWEYSVSHAQLLVRLYRDGPNPIPSAYILCKGCHSVHFEPYWKDSSVSVSAAEGTVTIADGERLRVVCMGAFGAEANETISIRDSAA